VRRFTGRTNTDTFLTHLRLGPSEGEMEGKDDGSPPARAERRKGGEEIQREKAISGTAAW
jgi:hypothetical protein